MVAAIPDARRLGIVGCGAAARRCHVPALVGDGPFRLTALVDAVPGHATAAAEHYGKLRIERGLPAEAGELAVGDDLGDVLAKIDAAVVATSHDSHAEVAVKLLRAGKHVLIEKPLALTVQQCGWLHAAAQAGQSVAMPAHVRRLFPSARWVKSVLVSGRLGVVRRVRWSEGQPYSWPVVSPFMFAPAHAGGGLLTDSGPHVFDILLYWFGQPSHLRSFADNSDGGTDSEVKVEIGLGTVEATVELSRLRNLSGRCLVEADHGTLTVDTGFPARFVEQDRAGRVVGSGPIPVIPPAQDTWVGLFREQLADFDRVISGGGTQLATFDEGVASVRLLEACRIVRPARLPRPWRCPRAPRRRAVGRVAVTGATGFIGSHLAERALASSGTVVAVAREVMRFARLSHLDHSRIVYVQADIRDRPSLAAAFRGSDIVVHTVYGSDGPPAERWSVSVDGTDAVLEAAIEAGVRRVIHISSVAVYDDANRRSLDESCPTLPLRSGDLTYPQQKVVAERRVLAAGQRGLEVVCLQPTVVYGPWGPAWTTGPLRRLPQANHRLPTGSQTGVCNAVHVQDVADAALFAATATEASGLRLLVSGPRPVNWGEFYDAHRSILGLPRPRRFELAELDDALERDLYRSQVVASTARLRALGFQPRIDFGEGMVNVAAWAHWAGYGAPAGYGKD
jgi:predicted dehydrogenase/nucleoside-diphosphate-sugar epimerase